MNLQPDPHLVAVVIPTATRMAPSARTALCDWLLAGCGVDVDGIKAILAESKEAARAKIEHEIEAVDREAQALRARREALLAQLRGGAIAHTHVDCGDVSDSAVR